ncbi:MAG TPA: aminotransferase class I/II-fold pyridoxal phosphate-dependent enzyme [Alphaproteobacteria bacterium]|nr:aminotransferase class I/II-fold pyridoxal phosphate-dependent enzyme [Alphaproteobacteria bacterium]
MSQQYFRKIVQNLPENPGAEMLRYGWRRSDTISLGQGEGCAPTPDFIATAASEAMRQGKTHYGPVLGQPALREEISAYYKCIFNVDLPANRIFITGSGTTAMHLALTSILDRDDEVVAITPIWKNLLGAVSLAQATTKQVPLDYSDQEGWSLDMDKLFAAYTPKTKAILVVTPSNPTGWTMTKDDMAALMDFARERGIWVVSDEVYNRSLYGKSHAPSFLEVAKEDDLLLTVNSFSKAWAMTGWRLGWLTGPAFAESVIRDIALYDNMGPPTFTQFGGITALRDGEEFISDQLGLWEKNLDIVMDRLGKHPKIHIYRPKATFYGFFKVEGEPDCLIFAKRLIDEVGLSLAPGCAFGQNCRGWMRLCFAVSPGKLNEALDRLEKAIG